MPSRDTSDHIVSGQEGEVGVCVLSETDHSVEIVETVERGADVQVHEHGDPETIAGSAPVGKLDFVVLVAKRSRLDEESPDGRTHQERQQCNEERAKAHLRLGRRPAKWALG